jgi:hypothetical protein
MISGSRLRNATCRLARSEDEMAHVFRLRYQCYLRTGAIMPSEEQSFSDPFDHLPNQFSFLLDTEAERNAASIRISVVRPDLGWVMAPSSKVFGGDPCFEAIAQGSFVEASRLCFREQAHRDLLYRLIANLAAAGDYFRAEWVVACPRVEHSHMYMRLFGFRSIAPARQYLGVNFRTDLLAIRLEELRRVAVRYGCMRSAWQAGLATLANALDPAVRQSRTGRAARYPEPGQSCGW